MAQYAHLSTHDPELAAGLVQLAQFPPSTDVQVLRSRTDARAASREVSFPPSQLKVQDWQVPVKAGAITVRTYVPQDSGAGHPLLVWAHGGGFTTGGLSTDDGMLKTLAVDLKLSIVNVDYRLAPEHKFPTGLNDTYEALKWAYSNRHQLDADTAKGFLLGGLSAGANFTAVLAHRARDDPELQGKLTGQILQVPAVVHRDAYPEKYADVLLSVEQNKDAPILSLGAMNFFTEMYGRPNPADPEFSPVYFPSHKDLPPALLQICGLDPLRDEGFLYEKLLQEDGVKTKSYTYPGLPHAFESFFPAFKQSETWRADMREGVRWLLRGGAA